MWCLWFQPFDKLQPFMHISVTATVLLFCAATVVTAQSQVSQTTSAPDASPTAPLKVGGDVTAPRPIYAPDAEYSEEARKANHNGTCVLSLIVGADGKPSNIVVLHPAGMGLDEKAVETMRTWTFEPARKEGKPVAVQIQVTMTFKTGDLGKPPRAQLKQMWRLQAEAQKRAQTLIYRIPDNGGPRTCPQSSTDEMQHSDPGSLPIDAASKYRLDKIAFLNNKALTNQELLRNQFPIKDGDVYDSNLIAKGLSNLQHAYSSIGYIDFTAVLHTNINDATHTISLDIYSNEGSQFFVNRIDIIGLDEPAFQNIKKEKLLMLQPGCPFNQRLVDFFLEKNSKTLSNNVAIEPSFSLQRNEQDKTVAVSYDFRPCPVK
jgi:TonB family protein